jgi:hypothetical protein
VLKALQRLPSFDLLEVMVRAASCIGTASMKVGCSDHFITDLVTDSSHAWQHATPGCGNVVQQGSSFVMAIRR